jgi:hypothetical protein
MGLLNPLLLALGTAAAVPLLLHLLQRQRGPRVVFPALRYLRRAEKESARRIRVRQLLLMLLRVAAVLLIALAAARPFLRADGVGHSPTAVVIVLDNSMSSAVVEGDARVLDGLKDRALDVLAAAGPDDTFWLLRAGSPGEPALAGDAAATALRVRETEPTVAQAELAAALRHAASILGAGADGRAAEIHLLSDLQAAAWRGPAAAEGTLPPVVIWHPATAAPANRSVGMVEVGGGLSPIAGNPITVAARVDGDGADAVNVRLSIDGRLAAAGLAQPGSAAVLTLPAQQPGILTGHVEIEADALRLDDRRYFATRVLPPPAVRLTGAAPFVSDALDALQSGGRVRRTVGQADVGIHVAAESTPTAGAGTSVVLPPESPIGLAAANRQLAAAGIPWRYLAPVMGEARFAESGTDPLLRALENTRLRQVYPLAAVGAATGDTLLQLDDGTPWAVRGERGTGGRYVLLGSPLTADASTIPVSAAMLPLMDRVTGAWAAATPPRWDVEPGARLALPAGATHVLRPDGSRDDVSDAADYLPGSKPGIYHVMRGDSVMAAFAVNPATAPLVRLAAGDVARFLPGWTTHVTSTVPAWRRAVFRERLGREIWRPLLLALLVVLVIETLVAAAGHARRQPAHAVPEVETG